MPLKTSSSRLCRRLTGTPLRMLVIRAGFPYHKAPTLYPWLWVFVLLPFLDEDSLNELSEKHGKPLRKLSGLLRRYPSAFERFVQVLSRPLLCDLLADFEAANATTQSRQRLKLIVDDTNAEKYGQCMEFLHTLYDHCQAEYIMGYHYVLLLVVSGAVVFPLALLLWLPADHPDHRSKNTMIRDELHALQAVCEAQGQTLREVEFLGDSAYCVQKVVLAAISAGFRVITTPSNTHTFEVNGAWVTPKELIDQVKGQAWKSLDAHTWYQRVPAHHQTYGDVILVVRQRQLRNHTLIAEVLLCTTPCYPAGRIHTSDTTRWTIEVSFKYFKQYLGLGNAHFGKLGSIRSQLACVALAGLVVTLFRRQLARRISFRQAVKLIAQELRSG